MPRLGHARQRAPLAVLAIAILLASLGHNGAWAQQPAVVKVDKVRTEPLSQTVPVIGRLVARQAGVVAARTSGPVDNMQVEVGDRVEKGHVIAVLDTERVTRQRKRSAALVAEAQSQVEQAEAEAKMRTQELARIEGLRDSVAFSQGRYEDAQQAQIVALRGIRVAEARLASAQADLALTDLDVELSKIRAPYPGVVVLKHTEVGAWLNIGEQVVTMVNDQDLEVEADVPSNRIVGLDPGLVVNLTLDDDSEHLAVVRAIVPEENALTRTRQVRFTPEFNGAVKPLAVNQSAVVRLPLGPLREVVTVHKDAIINRQGNTFVYVANGGVADFRPVILGEAVGTRFEVISGLGPGELVVVLGNERLRPGQPVTVDES